MPPGPEPVLTHRQEEILVRVVEEYVSTGAPVGSKTLVERAAMEVSSSTVRYELAVLEEQGLLSHPHTSAGRVPTDLGYRFFVDRVIEKLEPRPSPLALDLDFSELRSEVEMALQATTDALAEVTHLLALVSAPPLEATTVRRVEPHEWARRHVLAGLGNQQREIDAGEARKLKLALYRDRAVQTK